MHAPMLALLHFAVMGRHALIFRPSLTDSKLAMTVTMRMPMAVLPVALLRCAVTE
jgi:hypothetical protein